MFMNYNQYSAHKVKILNDLYNKQTPDMKEYLTNKFKPDDYVDLIKEMESEGLINNVRYVRGVKGHNHVIPSFENVAVTTKGLEIIEE